MGCRLWRPGPGSLTPWLGAIPKHHSGNRQEFLGVRHPSGTFQTHLPTLPAGIPPLGTASPFPSPSDGEVAITQHPHESGLRTTWVYHLKASWGLPWWLSGEGSACQCRRHSLIPGSGRPPGGGNGSPLQYSCLGNPTERGAWQATVRQDLATEQQTACYSPSGGQDTPHNQGMCFWSVCAPVET